MAYTIAGALLPIVITFLLGFIGAWRGDFQRQDASILNRLVLTYALPLMLFAGTLGTSRASLGQGVSLLIVSCVALVGMYGVVFVSSRVIFSVSTGTSALASLTLLPRQCLSWVRPFSVTFSDRPAPFRSRSRVW